MTHPRGVVYFPAYPDQLDVGFRQRELHSAYRYEWVQSGVRVRLTAPPGFKNDGASVPRIVWSFYPPHALDKAAVFHDLHYRRGGVMRPGEHQYLDPETGLWVDVEKPWNRAQADDFFFRLLAEDPDDPNWFTRQAAHKAVRLFGRGAWQG